MEQVTEQLLLQLTECKTLSDIRVISLRNKNIQTCLKVLSLCKNLVMAYLQYNRIQPVDLGMHLHKFTQLQKLDLSFNLIKKLPESNCFEGLVQLKILYLHDNMIATWNDLNTLKSATLIHLTLCRNPVCQIPGYRHQLVNQMKNLRVLDEFVVTDEERIDFTSPISTRFKALGQYMKVNIPKFQENLSADQHLFNLDVDIYRIKRLSERNSPSVRIQSYFRGYLLRSKAFFSYADRKIAAIKIQKVIRGWLYRLHIKKELKALLKSKHMDYLLYTQEEYNQFKAQKKIEEAIYKFVRRRRRERLLNYSATMVQKIFRAKQTKHQSYFKTLRIDEEPKLYFLKEQKLDFYKILTRVIDNNKRINGRYNLEELKRCVSTPSDYLLLRYPNPLTFKRHTMPLLQLISPSYACKVKVNTGLSKLICNGQSVQNIYLRFSNMESEKDVMSKLQKRLCHCSSEDTKLIQIKGLNETRPKKIYDNYQELLLFSHNDKQLLKEICHEICRNNMFDENENFLTFFPHIMNRISAAMKIQQSFRSFLLRKQQKLQMDKNQIIYPTNEYYIANALIQQRAANCISQWWKYFKMRRRIEAWVHINHYLTTIDRPIVYLEENIYINLEEILNQQTKTIKFIEQNLNFDFLHPQNAIPVRKIGSEIKPKNLDNSASINTTLSEGLDDQVWHLVSSNISVDTFRFRDIPYPKWVISQIQEFGKFKFTEETSTNFFNNFLGLIHKCAFDIMPAVKDYNEIVNIKEKTLNLNNGLNFISLPCFTVNEAKKRALLLALLTYNMKKKTFVKLYTQQSMCNGVFLKNLYDVWNQYSIIDGDEQMKKLINQNKEIDIDIQTTREKQRHQGHSGLILSERDRWTVEGHQILKFHNVEKQKHYAQNLTTKQRQQVAKEKHYNYLQNMFVEESNRIEINIQEQILENNENEQNDNTNGKEGSQKGNQKSQMTFKSSYNHLSSKEPVSALKNIQLRDGQNDSITLSKQYEMKAKYQLQQQQQNKAGTAWPSTRHSKQSPTGFNFAQQDANHNNDGYNNSTKNGSIKNFFHLRQSSQIASTQLPSQDHSPNTQKKAYHQHSQSQIYSALVSLKDSTERIGEFENLQLLRKQQEEQEELRLKQKSNLLNEKINRKEEIAKVKQINSIMKEILKIEQDANTKMYQRFNKEEKELINQLKDKDRERLNLEQQYRKNMVVSHVNRKQQKSQERDFCNNFSQIRNMISKQKQAGELMRLKSNKIKNNKSLVQNIKKQEEEFINMKNNVQDNNQQASFQRFKNKLPVMSTLFDSSQLQEMTFFKKPMTAVNSPTNSFRIRSNAVSNQNENRPQPQFKPSTGFLSELNALDKSNRHQSGLRDEQQLQHQISEKFHSIEQRIFDFGMNKNQFLLKNKRMSKHDIQKNRFHKFSFIEENYPINKLQNDDL